MSTLVRFAWINGKEEAEINDNVGLGLLHKYVACSSVYKHLSAWLTVVVSFSFHLDIKRDKYYLQGFKSHWQTPSLSLRERYVFGTYIHVKPPAIQMHRLHRYVSIRRNKDDIRFVCNFCRRALCNYSYRSTLVLVSRPLCRRLLVCSFLSFLLPHRADEVVALSLPELIT